MTHDRLCQICRIRPATVMIGRRRSDDAYRTLVCPECAAERVRLIGGHDLDAARVASGLSSGSDDRAMAYTCGVCGATLADIVADGRPGCCTCYAKFATELDVMIEEYQGRSCHVGKRPS